MGAIGRCLHWLVCFRSYPTAVQSIYKKTQKKDVLKGGEGNLTFENTLCLMLGRSLGKGITSYSCSLDCSGGSENEESACSVGDLGSVPGLGRSPGEGNSYSFQYSCLENSMNPGGLQSVGVAKSWSQLSD